MEYKKLGETYYIRMDRGDEIIGNILEICRKESIPSAIFSGIGGCSSAELQVFIPESGSFETEKIEGMLELVLFLVTTTNSITIPMPCSLSRRMVSMEWQEDTLNRLRYSILLR